jgi:hypothetical protein
MITVAEVIEQCAQIIDQQDVDPSFKHRMASHIRALAAQYEGCIVAELPAAARTMGVALYRALETK